MADLARSLEYDVERIFRFVADEIRYEPYAGVLRGAQGTLESRAGNSADQALLLAALFDASLLPYQFVSGPLDSAGREMEILSAATFDAASAIEQAATALRSLPPGVTPPDVASIDQGAAAIGARVAELTRAADATVVQQIDATTSLIASALASGGITVPSATTALPASERDAHTWLQLGSGPVWVDLDPVLPGATPGSTIARAGSPVPHLADDARHRVTFSIVQETISGGQLVQATILEQTEFADVIAATPVTFVTEKPEGLKGIGISIGDTLTGTVQYVPMLMVGNDLITADRNITFGTGGGILSSGQAGSADGETTAIWHEVRIESPNAAPVVARRELFDRIGLAARESGAVDPTTLPAVELVDLGPDNRNEYVPCRGVQFVAVAGGATGLGSLLTPNATDPPYGFDRFGHLYHNLRDSLAAGWGIERGIRMFSDAPNVASLSVTFALQADGTIKPTLAVDVWHRSFGSLPVTGTAATVPPGILAGAISHIAERMVFGEGMPADLGAPPPRVSVGRVFEEAARAGIGVRAIRGNLPPDLAYPGDAAARLGAALAEGWVAIVPARPVTIDGSERLGWWLVDPSSGATTDMLDNGRGGVFGDYAVLLWNTFRAAPWWAQLGICVGVAAVLALAALGVALSNASDKVKGGVAVGAGVAAYTFDKVACGGASPPAPGP